MNLMTGYWAVVERDRRGYPTMMRRLDDVSVIYADGHPVAYRVGDAPDAPLFRPEDVCLDGRKVTDR